MQLSWAEDTKNPNCWTVVYKWTIVSHLKSSFYRLLHLLFMIRVYSSQLVSSEKTQPFGKSCSRLSFLCVSLSVSVCQSDHYSRWQITGEQRSPAAPRPVWSQLPRFTYVPATGLKSSDGIAANKETRLSVCHQRTRAKKCGLGFFSLGLKCRCEQNERHTRSCYDYKATKRETGAESVSVPTTESTKSVWTDPLRPSLWPQMEIWWKMWTVKRALVKRACRSSRESWERLGIVFRQGHCEMTRKDSLYREKLEGVCGRSGCFESLG